MKLIIGNYNYSTWSMCPWLFVHRHELPVDVKCYDLNSDKLNKVLSERFSNNKVPVLVDGDTEVWDSLAIVEYLGERFPQSRAWPKGEKARAVARSVCAEFHSSFDALRAEAPMNLRKRFPSYTLSDAALADVQRIQDLWRYCRENFGEKGPWLFGKPTIADTLSAPAIMRFRSVNVELDETATAYCRTMDECPSIREWICLALAETHRVDEDELDWPSEPVTEI
ncbi:MAG: glutathione S-transferase [Gammaproteobacteria bacterium]|nr:glutathione S-transferase [Gammaproteobacteria bacterium]